MIAPIDFSRLQVALAQPRGWLELLVTLACIGIAWLVDRRVMRRREVRLGAATLPGDFIHIGFPLIALAVIRMLAYALHRLFPSQQWLPASELAIGTAIWGLAILYFLGVLPEIHATLADLVIPIGKREVSLLTIFTGIAAVVVTLVVTLWISGLIEQRLALATQLASGAPSIAGVVQPAAMAEELPSRPCTANITTGCPQWTSTFRRCAISSCARPIATPSPGRTMPACRAA